MSYVIASYGVTIAALVGYALHLFRERRRLRTSAERHGQARPLDA